MDKPANRFERMALQLGGGAPLAENAALTGAQRTQVGMGILNMAQQLIAAEQSTTGDSHSDFMQSALAGVTGLGQGVANAQKAQAEAQNQRDQRELNEMKLEQARREFDRKKNVEEIRKSMPPMKDFKSPKAYYAKLGSLLFQAGEMQQGLDLIKMGAPTTLEEQRSEILAEQKKQYAFYTPVYNAVGQLSRLRNLLDEEGGAASYSAMISFIKNLDDSVVREGEVATFGRFNGLADNMQNQLALASGSGFTEAIKDKMYIAAVEATKAAVNSYDRHARKNGETYQLLGLPPELIFPVLNYDDNIFKPRNQKAENPDDAADALYSN